MRNRVKLTTGWRRRGGGVFVCILTVLSVPLLGQVPAIAATHASVAKTVATANDASATAVSCSGPKACEAVGSVDTPVSQVAFAEVWNGMTWQGQTVPTLEDDQSQLSGISCISAAWCEAVGNGATPDGSGVEAIADLWNGTSWSTQGIPGPIGSSESSLSAVSCVTADACEAVGVSDAASAEVPFADGWNGATWNLQNPPHPPGGQFSELFGVSCSTATRCEAVGSGTPSGTNSDVDDVLAEGWNGSTWMMQPTPISTATIFSQLNSISCSSATACEAVGLNETTSGGQVALAEKWNGTAWALQSAFTPFHNLDTDLFSMGCVGASAEPCQAVGNDSYTDRSFSTFTEAWNGRRWSRTTSANVPGASDEYLYGTTCISSKDCEAVGDTVSDSGTSSNLNSLAEVWNGNIWKVQSSG
jgi:hypothetical protein